MELTLHTTKARARTTARRWRQQYTDSKGNWTDASGYHNSPQQQYDKLIALGPDPTPEAVHDVLGNWSWTTVVCACCGNEADYAVAFNTDLMNDPTICLHCIHIAELVLKIIKENEQ